VLSQRASGADSMSYIRCLGGSRPDRAIRGAVVLSAQMPQGPGPLSDRRRGRRPLRGHRPGSLQPACLRLVRPGDFLNRPGLQRLISFASENMAPTAGTYAAPIYIITSIKDGESVRGPAESPGIDGRVWSCTGIPPRYTNQSPFKMWDLTDSGQSAPSPDG